METRALVAVIETVDGELFISGMVDSYGCVNATLLLNREKEWEEFFADVEEFNEFILGLPITTVRETSEYQTRVYEPVASY